MRRFLENHLRFFECCAAGERSGLYYTYINSFLTPGEVAYIVNNCLAKVLITSQAKREVALAALAECPEVELCLIVDGPGHGERILNLDEATASFPDTPIADESLGSGMLYSSGIDRQAQRRAESFAGAASGPRPWACSKSSPKFWRFRDGMTYLSPAPLYHAAPWVGVSGAIRHGGTVIAMERFDPEQFLQLVERHRVTHTQLVPTMFSRLLKLPEATRRRYDLSSLETRHSRRGAVPRSCQTGDDRLVGTDHRRILQRDRRHGPHLLRRARNGSCTRARSERRSPANCMFSMTR